MYFSVSCLLEGLEVDGEFFGVGIFKEASSP